MKKKLQVLSMVLALTLVFSVFGNTVAFAADEEGTKITFSDEFNSLETLDLNSMYYSMEADVSNPEVTLTATTSDAAIIDVQMQGDGQGVYYFDLAAMGNGEATLTFTASDGAVVKKTLTVKGTGELPYTLTSDTNEDYSLANGSSNIVKLHYEDNDTYSFPYLVSSDENILKATLVDYDETNSDYYYRVDAVGNTGEKADLYMGALGYVPKKLCAVSVIENEVLKIDTKGEYICNVNDEYTFVVSSEPFGYVPSISRDKEDTLQLSLVSKVGNQYTYKIKALVPGTTLITAKVSGETASFYVTANEEDDFPIITTDDEDNITLDQGKSYTYKLSIMGGGVPVVTAGTSGLVSVQLEKKDGIDYYYKVTAASQAGGQTGLYINFPNSEYSNDYAYHFSNVTVKAGSNEMKSDTNDNFSLKKGESYTFLISNADSFYPGSNGVFKTEKIKTVGKDTQYKITAIGQPGQSTGFYMANGQTSQKVCVVTIAAANPPRSDTNKDFSVKQGASYTFRISNADSFYSGSVGVFKTEKVGTSGNYSDYKITAIGQPGQSAGFYMKAAGQNAVKVCVVTVGAAPAPVSDTNKDFSIKQGASYQFKISNADSFYAGSNNVFKTEKVKVDASGTYYKITAIGQPGQSAGFYMKANGQDAVKVCAVTISTPAPITIKSDTNTDFGIAKNASYQFRITAPGASSINFNTGTAGVFQVSFLRHTGDDFFYKITAIGQSGQQTGIYASALGQNSQKLCVASIK